MNDNFGTLVLSSLRHTWILDLDGTIVKHNGYKLDGADSLLPGAREVLNTIPESDMIIFLTSRTEQYKQLTETFLNEHEIRFDYIIYGAPYGERILLNDCKPSGLEMSMAINLKRDLGCNFSLQINEEL